jgi:hypothetical protein
MEPIKPAPSPDSVRHAMVLHRLAKHPFERRIPGRLVQQDGLDVHMVCGVCSEVIYVLSN